MVTKNTLKAEDLIIGPKGQTATLEYFKDNSNELGLNMDGCSMMFGLLPLSYVRVPIVKIENCMMNIEDWSNIFEPIQNQFSNDDINHFETYGKELAFVLKHKPKQIWTLVDGNDGELYIEAGYHICNRVHHFVTVNPWANKNLVVSYK